MTALDVASRSPATSGHNGTAAARSEPTTIVFPMSRHVERQARRTHEMMERLGVNAAALARLRGGEAYAEARMKCLKCVQSRECLLWLDADPPSAELPTFCPNLELFESCKKM